MINQENLSNGSFAEQGNALASAPDMFGPFQVFLILLAVLAVAYVVVTHILPLFKNNESSTHSSKNRHYTYR